MTPRGDNSLLSQLHLHLHDLCQPLTALQCRLELGNAIGHPDALQEAVNGGLEEGSFRLDLYHRLAVFPIDVPPLRNRIEDIAELCGHFLALMGKTSPRKSLSVAALDKLCLHDWPGNVRELAHVLERASILAEDSPSIRAEDIRLRRAIRK